jgi:hypothetical protein
MAVAPFIRPIRVQGGTFYTFPSCVEDLSFTFTNPNYNISFSKFALLDIPNIANPNDNENYVQLRSVPGAFSKVYDTSNDPNIAFAESFQNYALNLETLITSDPNYDSTKLPTVSERVFFKWLKEIGAIRFREANSSETAINNTNVGQRFVEEDETSFYSRVVKYVGDIDITNTSKFQGNTQAEIYIHVPTETGSSPYVLLKSETKDLNYAANAVFKYSAQNPLNSVYISGRTSEDTQPAGLDFRAYYDSEGAYAEPTYQLAKLDTNGNYVNDQWWWSFPSNNSYFLEPTRLNDPRNDDLRITGIGSEAGEDVYFRRSRLDGIGIDFSLPSYQQAVQEGAVNSWQQFNSSTGSVTFDFNAVLVYYDIVSQSNPNDRATNLYGVLFLDDVQQSTSGGFIPRFTKYKPNKNTNMNGNSYGFRINLRLDTNVEDTSVQASINDYNTFSMQLFSDALTELRNASDLFLTQIADISNIQGQIDGLKDLMLTQSSIDTIDSRVTTLEDQYLTSQAYFSNSKSLIELINRNYQEILNIYNNKSSVEIQYNTDVLKSGPGISILKQGGNVVIGNTREGYNFDTSKPFIDLEQYSQTPTSYNYTTNLTAGTNYVLFKTLNGSVFEPNLDLVLLIDDSQNDFETGQVIKVCFSTPTNLLKTSTLLDRKFTILTDASNRSGASSPYSVVVGSFDANSFALSENKPYFEIVCLDKNTFTFNIEKIR